MNETASIGRYVDEARTYLDRAHAAVQATARRRDTRAVIGGVTVVYLALYLVAIGHLRPGLGGYDLVVVSDPLSRMFRQMAPLTFEPVAQAAVGPVTLLVAPVNVAIGLVLAALVGVNLAVSYLAWRHPAACGIDAGGRKSTAGGILAGLPALLSGAACCGPVILIVVGVQASAALVAAFGFLVPAAGLLLVGSLLYVARKVDPTVARQQSA